jgi:predicted  nucleic acid-binding Zn-ribbon protein
MKSIDAMITAITYRGKSSKKEKEIMKPKTGSVQESLDQLAAEIEKMAKAIIVLETEIKRLDDAIENADHPRPIFYK